MLARWVLAGGIVLTSLVYGSKVQAQDRYCPPGEISLPFTGGIACAPLAAPLPLPNSGTTPRPAPPPEPGSKKYGTSYIAVVWHPKSNDVWASWNNRTSEKATSKALYACTKAMGNGCKILTHGWNGSVSIARGKDNVIWYGWGNKAKDARENVLKICQEKTEGCEVIHEFTSEPLKQPKILDESKYTDFLYDPAYDVSQSYPPTQLGQSPADWGYFAIAWLGGEQAVPLSNFVIASGFPSAKDAQKAALGLCKAQSRQDCLSLTDVDDQKSPMFGVYLDSQKMMLTYSGLTVEAIEKAAANECSKAGSTCEKVGIFDVRRADVSIHRMKK